MAPDLLGARDVQVRATASRAATPPPVQTRGFALYAGLSVPVIGAGIALSQGVSSPNTVLGFAILVALGVSVSGWALQGRRSTDSRHVAQPAPPAPAASIAGAGDDADAQ